MTEVDAYRQPQATRPGCNHQLGCRCTPPFHLRPTSPAEQARIDRLQSAVSSRPVVECLPHCSREQMEIHRRAMARIEVLMAKDPAPSTDDGRELLALVAVVEFYERGCIPRDAGSAG